MKVDKVGKDMSKFGMVVFLVVTAFLWGASTQPFTETANYADKVFVVMLSFIFSIAFGSFAYLTDLRE